jgi:hypothetical protein
MTKPKRAAPEVLPISPMTLTCPHCKASPGHDCETSAGGFALLHVARVKGAAALDAARAKRL